MDTRLRGYDIPRNLIIASKGERVLPCFCSFSFWLSANIFPLKTAHYSSMPENRTPPNLPSAIRISIFVFIGGAAGLVSALIMDPNLGSFSYGIAISSLLDAVFLSWRYRSKNTSVRLIIRISIGIVIGMILGSSLGGAFIGTLISFLFPSSFFASIFLIGSYAGMLLSGALIPMILVNISVANHEKVTEE